MSSSLKTSFQKALKWLTLYQYIKKGTQTDPTNYRPIAITCTLSKVFERLLMKQMNDYFHTKHMICPTQFGFRAGFSTHDALIYATDSWRLDADNKKSVHAAFLDLSKAFNSINHSIFNTKLAELGFDNSSRELLGDFISSRPQRVKTSKSYSDWINIDRGVPQGTVLGPLLFSLYLNDITNCVPHNCKLIQFADDTLVYTSNKCSESAKMDLQNGLQLISDYLKIHQLTMNAAKLTIS